MSRVNFKMVLLAAAAFAAVLAGCGGGGDDGGTPVAVTPAPQPATPDNFYALVAGQLTTTSEDKEPINIDALAVTSPEDSEPVAI
ncbi:MAG: hypothetical protein ACJ8HI_02970 [Massilia sp.]